MAGWRLQPGGAGLKARSSRRAAHCRLGLGFVRVRLGLSALPLRATERLLAPLVREEAVVVGVQRARGRDGHASAEQQLARRLTRLAGGCAVAGAAHATCVPRGGTTRADLVGLLSPQRPDAPTPSVSRHATRKAVAKRCGVLHVGTHRPAPARKLSVFGKSYICSGNWPLQPPRGPRRVSRRCRCSDKGPSHAPCTA